MFSTFHTRLTRFLKLSFIEKKGALLLICALEVCFFTVMIYMYASSGVSVPKLVSVAYISKIKTEVFNNNWHF